MTRTINNIIEDVLSNEGGYVNDARDAGGETNFGITISTARKQGYAGPMREMPRDFAFEVYKREYVAAPGFDKIVDISLPIASELVDTGVNMGPKVAATFLQRALNGLGAEPQLTVDGAAGANTRAALSAFLKKRGPEGEKRLLALLNALQGERYLSLAEGRTANKAFLYGWLGRIAA